jgi:preprotein translocase subunit SecG
MSTIGMILAVLMAVVGVLIIVAVILQSNREAGLGVMGGASSSDSYWSKNKGNSIEGSLAKYTKLLGIVFVVLGILVNFIG